MNNQFKLILVDPQPALCAALDASFANFADVEVVKGYFEKLPEFDCMVSAANSFGLMDGGVDLAITRFFGQTLQDQVQRSILEEYLGEQPVGTSFIIETDHPKHPFMEIAHTDNVYLAMKAMLLAIWQHNGRSEHPIKTVACPGLGTATGRVPFREAARQMALAYKYFLKPPRFIDWRLADERQQAIRYGGDMGLHLPPVK